jgi:hypothetical protein
MGLVSKSNSVVFRQLSSEANYYVSSANVSLIAKFSKVFYRRTLSIGAVPPCFAVARD